MSIKGHRKHLYTLTAYYVAGNNMAYISKWLYQKTKTGAINKWRVWTEGSKVFTEYGQVDGKLQTTVGQECQATNVGRSNERNPVQQAEFEAESMYKNQLRLKYSETIEKAMEIRIQPMLAQDGHEVKFNFPVDVQRKFDGARCLRIWKDGNQILLSRGNKPYSVKHIEDELKAMFPLDKLTDGELYVHGVPLQRILSWVKKSQPDSLRIEYHIYDMPCEGTTWEERKKKLQSMKSTKYIKFVETFTANSMEELVALHDQFVMEGYEGAIIRLKDGLYEFGKRSKALLKWKEFEDKEFLIVGLRAGTGKMAECPIFSCKNDINNETFDVVPVGDMETRKELFDERNIGKMITVKFKGRTEDGKPKIAVGKAIRTEEDMPEPEKKPKEIQTKLKQRSLFDMD